MIAVRADFYDDLSQIDRQCPKIALGIGRGAFDDFRCFVHQYNRGASDTVVRG